MRPIDYVIGAITGLLLFGSLVVLIGRHDGPKRGR